MAEDEVFGGGGEDVTIVIGVNDQGFHAGLSQVERRLKAMEAKRPTITVKAQFDDSAVEQHFARYTKRMSGIFDAYSSNPLVGTRARQSVLSHTQRAGAYDPRTATKNYLEEQKKVWRQIDAEQAKTAQKRIEGLRTAISARMEEQKADMAAKSIRAASDPSGIYAIRQARAQIDEESVAYLRQRNTFSAVSDDAARDYGAPLKTPRALTFGQQIRKNLLPAAPSPFGTDDDGLMRNVAAKNFAQTWRSKVLPALAKFSTGTAQDIEKKIQDLQAEARRHYFTGQTLTSTFTLPALAAGVGSAYMGAQLDDRMHKMPALTDTRPEEIPGLQKQIVGLSREIPQSAVELADALYQVKSVGKGFDVMRVSARGAAAGLGETKDVAEFATTALDAYSLSSDKAASIVDKLTRAVNLGKGEASQYAPAMGKVIGLASMAGVSIDQVMASMATMSRIGIKPDVAATSFNQMLTHLVMPTPGGTKALAKLGYTPSQMRARIRDDSKGGMAGALQEIVSNPKADMESVGQVFGEVRGSRAFLATAGTQSATYLKILKEIQNSSGEADRALGEMSKSFIFQWGRMLNAGKAAIYDITQSLMPSLTKALGTAADSVPKYISKISAAWGELGDLGGSTGGNVFQNAAIAGAGSLVLSGPMFHMLAVWKDLKAAALTTMPLLIKNPFAWAGASAVAMAALAHTTGSLGDTARGIGKAISDWKGPLDTSNIALTAILDTMIAMQAIKLMPVVSSALASGAARGAAISGGWKSMMGAATAVGGGNAARGMLNMGGKYLAYGSSGAITAGAGSVPYTVLGPSTAAAGYTGAGVSAATGATVAGAVTAAVSGAVLATVVSAVYMYMQGRSIRNSEIESKETKGKIDDVRISAAMKQFYEMASGNPKLTAIADAMSSSISANINDPEAISQILRDAREFEKEIRDMHMSPFDEKFILGQFDEVIRQVEAKRVTLKVNIKSAWESALGVSGEGPVPSFTSKPGPGKPVYLMGAWMSGIPGTEPKPSPKPVVFGPPAQLRQESVFQVPNLSEKDLKDKSKVDSELKRLSAHGGVTPANSEYYAKLRKASADIAASTPPESALSGRSSGDGSTGTGPTEAERSAVDSQVKALESKQEALRKLVSAYSAYEGSIDSILSKVREFTIRTESARVANEMHKKALDGVSGAYKDQAVEVAKLADKMQRIVTVKDIFKNLFAGMQESVLSAGGDPSSLNPFIAKTAKILNVKGDLASLQEKALGRGGALSQGAQTEQERLQQSINNLAASIDSLRATLSSRTGTSGGPSAAIPGTESSTAGMPPQPVILAPASIPDLLKQAKESHKRAPKIVVSVPKDKPFSELEQKNALWALGRSEYNLGSYDSNFTRFLGRKINPRTLGAENQWNYRRTLMQSATQEQIVDWARDKAGPKASAAVAAEIASMPTLIENLRKQGKTEEQINKILRERLPLLAALLHSGEQTAIAADRKRNVEAGNAQAHDMHVAREREANRIKANGDQIMEMELERARKGSDYFNMDDGQWSEALAGAKKNYVDSFGNEDDRRKRENEGSNLALWRGDQYLRSAGIGASETRYSQIVEENRRRAELEEAVLTRKKYDPEGAQRFIESEMAAYRAQRDSPLIAQSQMEHASRMTGLSDQSLNSGMHIGLLKGGMRSELADIEAQVDAAKREAFRGYSAKGDTGAAGKAATEAEALRKNLLDNLKTSDLSKYNSDLLEMSRSMAALGDETGYAAKQFELMDMQAHGLEAGKAKNLLDQYSRLQSAQESMGLGKRIASIGARNEIESLQAEYDYFKENSANLKPNARKSQSESYERRIAAAKIYVPREYATSVVRQGQERIAQQKLEFDAMRAVTVEQKADLIVQQAKLDAKREGIALDKETLELVRQQAVEQVKNEESLNRQAQAMSATSDGIKKILEGDLKGGISGTIHQMADNLRTELANNINKILWKRGKKDKADDMSGVYGADGKFDGKIPGKKGAIDAILGAAGAGSHDMAVELMRVQANMVEVYGATVNVNSGAGGSSMPLSGGKRGMSTSQFGTAVLGSILNSRR